MKRIIIICCMTIILIIIGCKDGAIETIQPQTDYGALIPLSVGNYWLYMAYLLSRLQYKRG